MMDKKIADLREKRNQARMLGGEKAVQKQHDKGKWTARERIDYLLDPGSFNETDAFMTHNCTDFGMEKKKILGDGVVTGFGTMDGRRVCIFSQDFTSYGGALGERFALKICKIMDLALKMGVPVIGLNDSGGARIQEGVASLAGYGDIFFKNVRSSGVVPQISAIMGPCAGGAVYSPALTDFIFMTEGTAIMHITGPQVIKAATGEEVSSQDLGGARMHATTSGVCHFAYPTEKDTLDGIRTLLSYIPLNNLDTPPYRETSDDPDRAAEDINDVLPDNSNQPYNMKDIITRIVDDGAFFEVHAEYATNIINGFARLGGHTVGITANQPASMAGCLDIKSSTKAARFVRFCDAFNIPLLTLVDVPGFLPGTEQEYGGIIRQGAKLLYAFCEATVPKITLIVRKSYGGAYDVMCCRQSGADMLYAWPSAELAVMGPQGATNIIHRREITASDNPEQRRAELIEEYSERFANPWEAAARGYIDEVIEPSQSRRKLIDCLTMILSKSESSPRKKHGNCPL
jgi:acetyl-CoA carboxylase carboxyltransferase component